jgi:hypothetical protein
MSDFVSELSQPDSYDVPGAVQNLIARALVSGRLRLILGAGVSIGCGLPNWGDLIDSLAKHFDIEPPGDTLELKAEHLFREGARGDRKVFAEAVRTSLYGGPSTVSLPDLSSNRLMVAIGALSMAGLRGGVSEIVTFNFDDLLERYLQYHGFLVRSTPILPALSSRQDVEILHLHGLLPSDIATSIPSGIVFTESDFDDVVGDRSDFWHQRVTQIMRSNVCLFMGLSMSDGRLRQMVMEVSKSHPILKREKYWGFRLCADESDGRREKLDDLGIHQVTIGHDEVADWLLETTQLAAAIASQQY